MPELTYMDPACKLGLLSPTSRLANVMAIASRVYHAVKFDHPEVVEAAINSGCFDAVMSLAQELLEHFVLSIGVG